MRWPWSKSRPEPPLSADSARSAGFRLVQVAYAANLPEAELIQNLLRQEHIPSMVQRGAPSNAPDFLVAGRRIVLVPASQADRARELLA